MSIANRYIWYGMEARIEKDEFQTLLRDASALHMDITKQLVKIFSKTRDDVHNNPFKKTAGCQYREGKSEVPKAEVDIKPKAVLKDKPKAVLKDKPKAVLKEKPKAKASLLSLEYLFRRGQSLTSIQPTPRQPKITPKEYVTKTILSRV